MKPDEALVLHKRLVDAFPAARSLMTPGNAQEWRSWLLALPYDVAARAMTAVIAGSTFPEVAQFLSACGFDCIPERIGGPLRITPAMTLLMAARDGGYEVVRDDTARHGWRSSQEALPEPAPTGVPCPPQLRQQMRDALARMEARHVKPLDVAHDAGDRAHIESTLRAADATFAAELERAQRAEAGEITEEELIPW